MKEVINFMNTNQATQKGKNEKIGKEKNEQTFHLEKWASCLVRLHSSLLILIISVSAAPICYSVTRPLFVPFFYIVVTYGAKFILPL